MQVCFGTKVSDAFIDRVALLCKNLGWQRDHVNWLMACMAFESGETFSSSVRNGAGSGATGLIQFMPATARGLGTSTDELSRMTAVQQLSYVEKYFKPYAFRINSLPDMYMAILMPKYVSAPIDSVLFSQGTIAYRQNAGLDSDKNGKITKREAAAKVQAKFNRGLRLFSRDYDIRF